MGVGTVITYENVLAKTYPTNGDGLAGFIMSCPWRRKAAIALATYIMDRPRSARKGGSWVAIRLENFYPSKRANGWSTLLVDGQPLFYETNASRPGQRNTLAKRMRAVDALSTQLQTGASARDAVLSLPCIG